MEREAFFTHKASFFTTFFPLMLTIALQNLIAYSVNMADNIMLGSYAQSALSGASTVNQLFFVVQQVALGIGDGLVVLSAQYWGKGETKPIRTLTGIALKFALICGVIVTAICVLFPEGLLRIFTNDADIIEQGLSYLSIIRWTWILFMVTNVLMAALRAVGTVRISFVVSLVSLIVNVVINYLLIFGRFGLPELGVRGAAIGTLVARIVELLLIVCYLLKLDKKLALFSENFLRKDPVLRSDYGRVELPIMLSQVLWAVSVPMQTAILGRLSSDAIAANSVATTFYQYLKVVIQAMSASSSVMIGAAIGRGDMKEVRAEGRTLSVLNIVMGSILGLLLFILRTPLLSLYSLNDSAMVLADHLIIVMSLVMIGMSYQMPVSMGIIRGGGDTKFVMLMNMISVWAIVMPLSFLSAFVWRLPVELVVLVIQSDQIFKGLPTFLRFRSYKWIRKLTRV